MLGRSKATHLGVLTFVVILLAISSCSKDKIPTKPSINDLIPPAAVIDLAVGDPTTSSVTLTWTAPGNDTTSGTAARYDIRYYRLPITDANWALAPRATGPPKPKPAGSKETFVVTGLSPSSSYYFALKAADEKPNWSALSNVPDDSTLAGPIWSPLGSGTNGDVSALTVYNGQLIAGGMFTTAGGVPANYVAAWNGSSWSPLGAGTNMCVLALTVYNGQLIAGGNFSTAGDCTAFDIAAWNGSSWSPLGSGLSHDSCLPCVPVVRALTVYNGQLIAGGMFTTAGDVFAHCIAAWNGSSWAPLGSGTSGQVYALVQYVPFLAAGGAFMTAGGVSANFIATWNGSSWAPLGSGSGMPNSEVMALTIYNGQLIVGGGFNTAGGIFADGVAAWSDSSWSLLGLVMSGSSYYPTVRALTVYGGQLIAGGTFDLAGGVSVNHVAASGY